jgi:hypothetical protein
MHRSTHSLNTLPSHYKDMKAPNGGTNVFGAMNPGSISPSKGQIQDAKGGNHTVLGSTPKMSYCDTKTSKPSHL